MWHIHCLFFQTFCRSMFKKHLWWLNSVWTLHWLEFIYLFLAFGACFYPKQLDLKCTLYQFLLLSKANSVALKVNILSVHAFPGNQTHDLGVLMLWFTETLSWCTFLVCMCTSCVCSLKWLFTSVDVTKSSCFLAPSL